ncbi:helix-turn-helix domain-containing protein [Streptomyces sp. NPDC058665]|uniref:helix-turn-helix domain-containing protein n=1 Tax=Streptomyces sp. NPDC058665 TaxID=3346586 RepID=UPI003661106B
MGRRENPIAPCDRELEKLVRSLRDQRARAGLTYSQLAARSEFSASTLIRAASGEQVPKLQVVLAYAEGCGADPDDAERLWKRARYRAARGDDDGHVPHPCYVRDIRALHAALVDLYRKDGARTYEELENASDGVLAHATIWRFLHQKCRRPSREFVLAFAQACGEKGRSLREWGQAWDRSEEQRLNPGGVGARRRSNLLVETGRYFEPRVQVFSDPARTPDGQESRRLIFEVDAHPALTKGVITTTARMLSQVLEGARRRSLTPPAPLAPTISAGANSRSAFAVAAALNAANRQRRAPS